MSILNKIWKQNLYQQDGESYSDKIALTLQPASFADFGSHPEFAEIFRLWTQNDKFRGLDFVRIWSLLLNAKHTLSRCSGSVAELGVYQGQSSAVLSFYAAKFERKMYLCDTFNGFSEAQYEENMGLAKQTAFKDISYPSVRAVVGEYQGNRWVIGMFPQSITDEMREDRFAFVSIDCDLYEPIRAGLDFFWPRLVVNGMIFVHDYSSGHWPGATRAVDEFIAQSGAAGCLLPDLAGSFVIVRPDSADPHEARDPDRSERARLAAELRTVYGSRSWRLTRPLRAARELLKRA
jgi:hypothetical protein